MAADASVASYDVVDIVVKLVTTGGFGALVWFLVAKHLPAVEARHQEERKEWLSFMKRRDEALEDVIKDFREAIVVHGQQISELRIDVRGSQRT